MSIVGCALFRRSTQVQESSDHGQDHYTDGDMQRTGDEIPPGAEFRYQRAAQAIENDRDPEAQGAEEKDQAASRLRASDGIETAADRLTLGHDSFFARIASTH